MCILDSMGMNLRNKENTTLVLFLLNSTNHTFNFKVDDSTLIVASSLADTIRLKTGWKITLLIGALCPVRLYFSGGLGIHSDGDRLLRVGAPSMNSFSASESFDSSSIT